MNEKFSKQKEIEGKEWLNKYIKILDDSCSDFREIKLSYENACLELRKNFKDIDKYVEYTNDMLISCIEFSFEQGLNDNLEHFKNPQAPTFLEYDYSDCLKEENLLKKSDYAEAATKRKQILDLLPNDEDGLYDDIIVYQVFLDTYIPKMAHFYGFVTGNTLLKKIVNAYKPDCNLTKEYKEWLSVYLGLELEE